MIELTLSSVVHAEFVILLVFAVVFYSHTQSNVNGPSIGLSKEFRTFQKIFFGPYFLALFSDWLQGPYVYKLYSYYGFEQRQIAVLYISGFASSVCLGTATGPLADKFGRKRMAIIFCLTYALCCVTKMSSKFHILLCGRILGGISTSILFSVFESWYIHQHTIARKHPIGWASITFSQSTFFNGVLAIVAGVAAQTGAETFQLGPVSPFLTAIPFLLVAAVWIGVSWEENYGEQNVDWVTSYMHGYRTIMRNPNILMLGLVQSLFESNMYMFVFMFTPVLEPGHPPLGLTFSSFMTAFMIGSSLYTYLLSKNHDSDTILTYCCALMAVSMFACALCTTSPHSLIFAYLSFLALEMAIGMYMPCMSTLRSETIPDHLRTNIMNWFRVPMNFLTCGGLVGMHQFEHPSRNQLIFLMCGCLAVIGYCIAKRFSRMPKLYFEIVSG